MPHPEINKWSCLPPTNKKQSTSATQQNEQSIYQIQMAAELLESGKLRTNSSVSSWCLKDASEDNNVRDAGKLFHVSTATMGEGAIADSRKACRWDCTRYMAELKLLTTNWAGLIKTRLPSSLRPTTHECVHLVKCGHFWSCNKDGGHTIWSAVAENLTLHADLTAVCFTEQKLLPISFTLREQTLLLPRPPPLLLYCYYYYYY